MVLSKQIFAYKVFMVLSKQIMVNTYVSMVLPLAINDST